MGEPTIQIRLQGVTYERFKEAFMACESVIYDYYYYILSQNQLNMHTEVIKITKI